MDPQWARFARVLDVENGAAGISTVVPFLRIRRAHGWDDATIYCNRSNHATIMEAVRNARIPQPRYWIATLDGTKRVSNEWATQYQGGMTAAFDMSVLHGIDDFHTP